MRQLLVTLENLMNLLGDMGLTEEQDNVVEHMQRLEQSAESREAEETQRLEALGRALYGKIVDEQEQRLRMRKRHAAELNDDLREQQQQHQQQNQHEKQQQQQQQDGDGAPSAGPDLVIEPLGSVSAEDLLEARGILDFHEELALDSGSDAGASAFDIGIHSFDGDGDDGSEDDALSWDSELDVQLDVQLEGGGGGGGELDDVEGGRAKALSRGAGRSGHPSATAAAGGAQVLNVGQMMSFLGGMNNKKALHEMRARIGNDAASFGNPHAASAAAAGQPRRDAAAGTMRRSKARAAQRQASMTSANADDELPSGNCLVS